ncbi:MAG: hypothetical protein VW907_00990 [Opitutae bacterium]
MAEYVLSHPFRIDNDNSRPATVYSSSATHKGEQINAIIRTEKDERPLLDRFGMNDPTFHRFDAAEFLSTVRRFYDQEDLLITDIKVKSVSGVDSDVLIEFE